MKTSKNKKKPGPSKPVTSQLAKGGKPKPLPVATSLGNVAAAVEGVFLRSLQGHEERLEGILSAVVSTLADHGAKVSKAVDALAVLLSAVEQLTTGLDGEDEVATLQTAVREQAEKIRDLEHALVGAQGARDAALAKLEEKADRLVQSGTVPLVISTDQDDVARRAREAVMQTALSIEEIPGGAPGTRPRFLAKLECGHVLNTDEEAEAYSCDACPADLAEDGELRELSRKLEEEPESASAYAALVAGRARKGLPEPIGRKPVSALTLAEVVAAKNFYPSGEPYSSDAYRRYLALQTRKDEVEDEVAAARVRARQGKGPDATWLDKGDPRLAAWKAIGWERARAALSEGLAIPSECPDVERLTALERHAERALSLLRALRVQLEGEAAL